MVRSFLATAAALVALASSSTGGAAPARGPTGLQLQSTTTGAEVIVDGQLVGRVPLPEVVRLKPGKHTLKLVKPGYTQYLDVFTVTRGKVTTLDLDLLPVAGILEIQAQVSEAKVFVDGKFVGTTPLQTEVTMGKRALRVSKAGYYDFVGERQAIAGEVLRMTVRLKPLPVGTTPYQPAPPPPPKWYERWYVWAGAAGAATAATAIILGVTLSRGDRVDRFGPEHRWRAE
ncbi:MAG: PEGA domain-containing protein [Deltaproteobacteria bacterium]|nr:PEGA domain-containing protein [Deltaproteobacteria bacterium]